MGRRADILICKTTTPEVSRCLSTYHIPHDKFWDTLQTVFQHVIVVTLRWVATSLKHIPVMVFFLKIPFRFQNRTLGSKLTPKLRLGRNVHSMSENCNRSTDQQKPNKFKHFGQTITNLCYSFVPIVITSRAMNGILP